MKCPPRLALLVAVAVAAVALPPETAQAYNDPTHELGIDMALAYMSSSYATADELRAYDWLSKWGDDNSSRCNATHWGAINTGIACAHQILRRSVIAPDHWDDLFMCNGNRDVENRLGALGFIPYAGDYIAGTGAWLEVIPQWCSPYTVAFSESNKFTKLQHFQDLKNSVQNGSTLAVPGYNNLKAFRRSGAFADTTRLLADRHPINTNDCPSPTLGGFTAYGCDADRSFAVGMKDDFVYRSGGWIPTLPNDQDMTMVPSNPSWGPEPEIYSNTKYATDPTRFISTNDGSFWRGVEWNGNPSFTVPTPIWGLSAPVPYGPLPVVYSTHPLAPFDVTLIPDLICNIPVLSTVFPTEGTPLPIEFQDFYDQSCLSRAWGVCVLCKKTRYIPERASQTFVPMSALSTYWANKFRNESTFLLGSGDLEKLGFALHGAGDVSVPHHVLSTLGNYHELFEAQVDLMRDHFASPGDMAKFRVLQGRTLIAGGKNQSSVYPNGLPELTTGPVTYQSSVHDILNKTAHWAYSAAGSVVDISSAPTCDPGWQLYCQKDHFMKDAAKTVPMMAATVVMMLTKAANDYYARDNNPATPESINNDPGYALGEVTLYGHDTNGRLMMRYRDGAEGRRTWSFGQGDHFLSQKRNGFTGTWTVTASVARPGVVGVGPRRVALVVNGSDDQVYMQTIRDRKFAGNGGPAGTAWKSLGRPPTGPALFLSPAIASWDPFSRVVVVTLANGDIFYRVCANDNNGCREATSGWGAWTQLPPGPFMTVTPESLAAISIAQGRVDIVVSTAGKLHHITGTHLNATTKTFDQLSIWRTLPDIPDPLTGAFQPRNSVALAKNHVGGFDALYVVQFYASARAGGDVSMQRFNPAMDSWGGGQVGTDIRRFGSPGTPLPNADPSGPGGRCTWVSAASRGDGNIEIYCGSNDTSYVLRYDDYSLNQRYGGYSAGQRAWIPITSPTGRQFDYQTPISAVSWEYSTPTNDTYENAIPIGQAGGTFQNHTLLLEDTVACDNSGNACVLNNNSPDAFYKLTLDTASRVKITVEGGGMAAILQKPTILPVNIGTAVSRTGQEVCETQFGVTSKCIEVRWGSQTVESGCTQSLSQGCVTNSGASNGCNYADVQCATFTTYTNPESNALACDADGSWVTGNGDHSLLIDGFLAAGTYFLWLTEWGFNLGCGNPTQSLTSSNHPFAVTVETTTTNDDFAFATDISNADGTMIEAIVRPVFNTSLDHFAFPEHAPPNHLICPADTEQPPNNLFGSGIYVGTRDIIYTARFDVPTAVRFDLLDGSIPYTQLPRFTALEDVGGYVWPSHPEGAPNCTRVEPGRLGAQFGELFSMKPGVRYFFVFSPPLDWDIDSFTYVQEFFVNFFTNDTCGSADNLPLYTTTIVTTDAIDNYSRAAFVNDYGVPVNPPNLTPPACYPSPETGNAPDKIYKFHLGARAAVKIQTQNADFPHLIYLANSDQSEFGPRVRQGGCNPTCFLAERVDSCIGSIIACSGDLTNNGRIIHQVLPAGNYALVIDGVNGAEGQLELQVDIGAMVDDCSTPGHISAAVDGEWKLLTTNDLTLYNDSRQLSCGRAAAEHDAFYGLSLPRWAHVELETRAPLAFNPDGTRGDTPVDGFDTTLGLLAGPDCAASTQELACSQNEGAAGKYSRIDRELEAGAYFAVVDGYAAASDASRPTFDLWGRFSTNDTIEHARSLRSADGAIAGRSYADSNAGFANDYWNIATCVNVPENVDPTSTHGSDAVFEVTLTEDTRLNLALAGLVYGVLYIVDASKPLGPGAQVPGACSAASYNGTTWGSSTLDVTLKPGTYYVIVDQSVGAGGNYTLTVNHTLPDRCQPITSSNSPQRITIADRATSAIVRGNTSSLTNDYSPATGCVSASKPASSARDAVYKFYIGTQGTRVQLSATAAPGSPIDPVLTLRQGTPSFTENTALCESGTLIACNDDGGAMSSLGSHLDVIVPSAGWYYVFVDSVGTAHGAFELSVSMFYPETCESAFAIGPGTYSIDTSTFPSVSPFVSLYYGTSCALTSQGQDDTNSADATYRITVPAGGRNVTLRLSTPVGSIQPVLYVTRADACPELDTSFIATPANGQLGCNVAPYVPSGGATATLNMNLAAGDYFVFVDSRWNLTSGRGPMTLTVDMAPETMASAELLSSSGASTIANSTYALNDYSGSCGGGSAPDLVYTFSLTSQQRVQINTAGTDWDTVLYLTNSAGAAINGVNGEPGCNDDSEATRQSSLDLTLGPGTYYVVLDGYDSASKGPAVLNAFWTPCPEIATFSWLATSCSGPQNITFKVNGTTAYSAPINESCTCQPGIARYTTTDPQILALFASGMQNMSIQFDDGPYAALAWAMISLGRQGDVIIYDHGNDGSASSRNADLCGAGYAFNLSPGGAFAISSVCKNSSDLSWRQSLHSLDWVVQPGDFNNWHLPAYDQSWWDQPRDVGPVLNNPVWGTIAMPPDSTARWLWHSPVNWGAPMERIMSRKTFKAVMPSYTFVVAADNAYDLYLDGIYLGSGYDWGAPQTYRADVTVGTNATLAITVHNDGGPGGFAVDIRAEPEASDAAEIWIDDALPPDSNIYGAWQWGAPALSGAASHSDPAAAGAHQHYFENYYVGVGYVGANDVLIASVYLDPNDPPNEVMLQWNDGSWEHRAYWGQNAIAWGTNGSNSRRYVGPLPATGEWIELRVPAASVGLAGAWIYGVAFTQHNGKAYWDRVGVIRK